MSGYSHRHLKQFDLAFKHYKRAIELEPRHRGAHEYVGEAYLMTGELASAEKRGPIITTGKSPPRTHSRSAG